MNKEFNFKKWSEQYHNKEVVELKKYFTIENFNTISKLGIKIKDKIYTQYEFEVLSMDILAFFIDDDMFLLGLLLGIIFGANLSLIVYAILLMGKE